MVGFTGSLPGHVGVELSEEPDDEDKEGAEGDPEPEVHEAPVQEHGDETESEGLHADAALLVVGGGHHAATGRYHVESAGELGFRGGGNEIREGHLCYFINYKINCRN